MQVAGLDHVNIVTPDLPGTIAFYQTVLGLAEVPTAPMPVGYVVRWLADAAGRPIFHVQQYDPKRHGNAVLAPPAGPIDHIALECRDFPAMVARCEDLGIAYRVNEMAGRTFRQLFLTDPNGVVLELNFRDEGGAG